MMKQVTFMSHNPGGGVEHMSVCRNLHRGANIFCFFEEVEGAQAANTPKWVSKLLKDQPKPTSGGGGSGQVPKLSPIPRDSKVGLLHDVK